MLGSMQRGRPCLSPFAEQVLAGWRADADGAGCAQVNVLNYLQSIINGQATANPVMDSPITALIVHMLRAPQQGAFQVLLATILGLLLRHCTFIPAGLAQCGALPLPGPPYGAPMAPRLCHKPS